MAEINQEETQQELFTQFSGASKRIDRFPLIQKTNKPILINTSLEQVILAAISLILMGCFVFFLGVLRGKFIGGGPALANKQQVVPVKRAAQVSAVVPVQENQAPAQPEIQKQNIAAAANKPYTIQLSTYKNRELAEKEASTLKKSGFFSVIIPSDGYYQVCVGQYALKDEAKKDLKRFNSKYKGAFLRRK